MGKKKQPVYRVVAADSRSPRDGRFIEIVGTYNPRMEPSVIEIDNAKAVKWLRNGAQPSERVQKLLQVSGGWDAFKAGKTPEEVEANPPEMAAAPPPKAPKKKAEEAPAPAPAAEEAAAEAPAEEAPAEAAAEAPAEEAAAEAPAEEAAAEAPAEAAAEAPAEDAEASE